MASPARALESFVPELNDDQGEAIRIGTWRFYPELNRLRDTSSVIQLEPKAALVLKLLVERAGKLVTRQELLDNVWENVVVSDDALTQVIIKLRKALGDNSRDPRYIRTVPKRGYCLIADVAFEAPSPGGHSPEAHAEQPVRRPSHAGRSRISWVALVVLALAAMSGYLAIQRSPTTDSATDVVDKTQRREDATLSVMPFEAITGGERESRFARGIRADLVTDLGGVPELTIIGPSLGQSASVTPRYRVEGSVQQVGERISVQIRLFETTTAEQLWSQRYERTLDDLFEVQRSIGREVVRHLALEVSAADLQRLASRYTPNLGAYEDFLRGQAELLKRESAANIAARDWYRQAIERDPDFARAYAGLALSYAADYRNHWAGDGQEALGLAREMAQTAVQIDPNISEVYWVLAYVAAQNRQHEVALAHLQRALEIDRSYADGHALMGGINTYVGRPELSIEQLRSAMRLNPDAGYLYYLLLGRAYYFTGRHEQAMINLREAVARNPTNLETHVYLLATAVSRNDSDTAAWEADEIRIIDPGFSAGAWLKTYPMTDRKQLKMLSVVLARLGL